MTNTYFINDLDTLTSLNDGMFSTTLTCCTMLFVTGLAIAAIKTVKKNMNNIEGKQEEILLLTNGEDNGAEKKVLLLTNGDEGNSLTMQGRLKVLLAEIYKGGGHVASKAMDFASSIAKKVSFAKSNSSKSEDVRLNSNVGEIIRLTNGEDNGAEKKALLFKSVEEYSSNDVESSEAESSEAKSSKVESNNVTMLGSVSAFLTGIWLRLCSGASYVTNKAMDFAKSIANKVSSVTGSVRNYFSVAGRQQAATPSDVLENQQNFVHGSAKGSAVTDPENGYGRGISPSMMSID